MSNYLTLYHGSDKIIERPVFGAGNPHNDFGLGFYCTESDDVAKEWASVSGHDGLSNRYVIDVDGLRILKIQDLTTMEWLAVLLENRTVTIHDGIGKDAFEYITENFHVDTDGYDIITGYRADDRYFSFVKRFLENTIGYRKLSEAMNLGRLGIQIMIKSEKAFDRLKFEDTETAAYQEWSQHYADRINEAVTVFDVLMNGKASRMSDLYIINIIQEGMKRDDPRL